MGVVYRSGDAWPRGCRDEIVVLDPALPPKQRRRQIWVVRYGGPVATVVLLAGFFVSMGLTAIAGLSGGAQLTAWAGVVMAWMVATSDEFAVLPRSRVVDVMFERYAPAPFRKVLAGRTVRADVAQLHQVLLELTRSGQVTALPVSPGEAEHLLAVLWSAVTDTHQLGVREVTATVQTSGVGASQRRFRRCRCRCP